MGFGKLALCAAALAASAGSASAQITAIGPFTGPYTESFETQAAGQFTQCLLGRVFNNTADLCDSTGTGALVTIGWSFMCQINPHSGGHFTGSAGGPYLLTFDTPVTKFGSYFGTNSGTDGAVLTFSDANGAVIGTQNATTAGCSWTWNGWQSTVPVKTILITGNNPFGGGFTDLDDMEYDVGGGPAPCYPNCDNSTTSPILNVLDFSCFLNKFAAGDTYANCDHSTTSPVLNVLDFGCFLNAFAAGCT